MGAEELKSLTSSVIEKQNGGSRHDRFRPNDEYANYIKDDPFRRGLHFPVEVCYSGRRIRARICTEVGLIAFLVIFSS
jgi:hypothetical protein